MNIAALIPKMILLFALIFLGYFATKLRLLGKDAKKTLADLVLNISCPATTVLAVAKSSHAMSNMDVIGILLISAAIFGCLIAFSYGFTAVLRIKKSQAGIYRFMIVFSNCGFLGFPVVQALSGGDAVFIASMYNLIFSLLVFTFGINQVASAGDGGKQKFDIKMLCTPMLITTVLSLILYLCSAPFHPMVVEVLEMLDKITAPASMLVIGCALAAYPMKQILGKWQVYVMSLFRLIILPVVVWAVLRLFITNEMVLSVLVVMTALPVATNGSLLCAKYGGDESTAASGLFISTLLSLVTLPLLLQLLF